MRSRWDMQDHPPDILITNFSMLSVMLMRDADEDIFEKTRQWLGEETTVSSISSLTSFISTGVPPGRKSHIC